MGLPPVGSVRLRGAPHDGPHVAWNEHVVDNEGLDKKKSKSTCLQELMLGDICMSIMLRGVTFFGLLHLP